MKNKGRRLNYFDRQLFEKQYSNGMSLAKIAAILKIHLATVYRELERGNTGKMDSNGRWEYSADLAQTKILKGRGRHKAV